ncbi:hypothetical protein RY27_20870 [Litorilinea aerophila]|nr:hypothetical protein RY27_20870 [Litorilinea aerophila]
MWEKGHPVGAKLQLYALGGWAATTFSVWICRTMGVLGCRARVRSVQGCKKVPFVAARAVGGASPCRWALGQPDRVLLGSIGAIQGWFA